ncbi:MAG: hypothetical protein A3C80_04400 [Candidatus Ryanbacteria bacterium RIFCSPHIGHO2_02_FULL_45_43]|uniref:Aspartyl/glutamyl-tRNA(Asn/Gln) amidotransferase subunit C n=1 Tax=Candidatus Ryanbacteria bacterium RIFCSPHIGHO2_01_45_13 TaxID=1802112 RepID=A0A1G2FVU8_9BACT|nr:MAG: hypothetical protein A2W41_00485 [Candidatus Ryanbacteria bacterium RIFCSPHIGHO2_01_45_13]OGZ42622.1 MAG: hypothetical protein A2718_04300 [Candidatus Ryanbacteria bacterium RIFCSPHIGHO2_01_FULL_44_130]OGZ49116.1 MAG: hypothetical protein A3C80_04400 [Candidatus Ryanbacteria bacterium RIFCSPHIGHO2_02_FULL_45_43]OGZ50482.1 MAG: hypothetical protein A3E55_02035 [Candidatus Ryanbacteria bacterium RIFCSPHIGHO2_12_FULL_44_20]OGZ51375.1 MAG: hypothetical protein A3A17_00095 [Candidatus Ryanba
MISKDEIKHLAILTRLELSDREVEEFQKDLTAIIDYVSELRSIHVEGVLPMTHAEPLFNIMREDACKEPSGKTVQQLTNSFPDAKDGYLKVSRVFER